MSHKRNLAPLDRVEAPSQARVSKPKFRFVVIFLRRIPFRPMDLERASLSLIAHRSFDAVCRESGVIR
jgi:hypothetical protein